MGTVQVIHPKTMTAISTALITAVATYFGYEQVTQYQAGKVEVEVVIPKHETHQHKNWLLVIQRELDKARKAHTDIYH